MGQLDKIAEKITTKLRDIDDRFEWQLKDCTSYWEMEAYLQNNRILLKQFQEVKENANDMFEKMLLFKQSLNQFTSLLEKNKVRIEVEEKKNRITHEGIINVMDSTQRELATSGMDSKICIWSLEDLTLKQTITLDAPSYCIQLEVDKLIVALDTQIGLFQKQNTGQYTIEQSYFFENISSFKWYDNILVAGTKNGFLRVWTDVIVDFEAHEDHINEINISGEYMLTCSKDTTAKLWRNNQLVQLLDDHSKDVFSAIFYDQTIITASYDNFIGIWTYTDSWRMLRVLRMNQGLISMYKDEKEIISAYKEGVITVWCLNKNGVWKSKLQLETPSQIQQVQRSGERIFVIHQNQVLVYD